MSNRFFRLLTAFLCLFFGASSSHAQDAGKTLAERLGFPRDAKAPDRSRRRCWRHSFGKRRNDQGSRHRPRQLREHYGSLPVVSGNLPITPRAHPDLDFGLHLTLTSERVYYRWGPVASKIRSRGLIDENGYSITIGTLPQKSTPTRSSWSFARKSIAPTPWASVPHISIPTNIASTRMVKISSKSFYGLPTENKLADLHRARFGLRTILIWSPA